MFAGRRRAEVHTIFATATGAIAAACVASVTDGTVRKEADAVTR